MEEQPEPWQACACSTSAACWLVPGAPSSWRTTELRSSRSSDPTSATTHGIGHTQQLHTAPLPESPPPLTLVLILTPSNLTLPPSPVHVHRRGPPFTSQSRLSAYFLACNRGKQSCCINLKHPRGRELVLALAAHSDVLVENFLPGDLEQLGLGFEDVHRVAPHCHYASLTSYGAQGPLASTAGYDVMVAAEGGLLSLTGSEAEPARGGIALTDICTGLSLCNAILAALLHDRRPGRSPHEPVVGQRIATSLFATQLALLSSVGQAVLLDPAYETRRWGTAHPSIVPYQAFTCGDGRMLVAGALNDGQWAVLCRTLHLVDLAADDRFRTNPLRVQHRTALLDAVGAAFRVGSADEWVGRLQAAGLPCARINDVRTALEGEQAVALGMVREVEQEGEEEGLRMIAPAVSMSGTPTDIRGGAPLLAQHTQTVLKDVLGYSDAQVQQLRADGVVH